jgi:hypothetical protein
MRFGRFLAAFLASLDRWVAMVIASFDFCYLLGLGVVAVILRLHAGIAIPKPRRNGDETAHALAGKRRVGQPIDSFLRGCPTFGIDDCAAKISSLCALNRHLTLLGWHILALFFARSSLLGVYANAETW